MIIIQCTEGEVARHEGNKCLDGENSLKLYSLQYKRTNYYICENSRSYNETSFLNSLGHDALFRLTRSLITLKLPCCADPMSSKRTLSAVVKCTFGNRASRCSATALSWGLCAAQVSPKLLWCWYIINFIPLAGHGITDDVYITASTAMLQQALHSLQDTHMSLDSAHDVAVPVHLTDAGNDFYRKHRELLFAKPRLPFTEDDISDGRAQPLRVLLCHDSWHILK